MLALKILVGIAFLLAGGAKLASAKPLSEQFQEFGLPKSLMYLVGALEVAGAVGLFLDPLAAWASLGLAGLMVGAVANHLKVKHRLSQAAPSLLLLALTAALAAMCW